MTLQDPRRSVSDKLDDGKAALKELQDELEAFKGVAQKDKQEVPLSQQRVLQLVGRIEGHGEGFSL